MCNKSKDILKKMKATQEKLFYLYDFLLYQQSDWNKIKTKSEQIKTKLQQSVICFSTPKYLKPDRKGTNNLCNI